MLPIITYIIVGLVNILVVTLTLLSLATDVLPTLTILEVVIIILALGYFNYIFIEKLLCKLKRRKFKYVIHVNGIRGKSTTTRLIDAGLRNCGFKVFSKTTGTIPTMINTDNVEMKVTRLGNANIREQIKMINRAYKEKAEVLVLECMAVNPELQYISEHHILEADVTVITNVRPDHINDMGETLEDIAYAFCNTIPTNGHLVINEGDFVSLFKQKSKERNTECHVATPYTKEDTLNTFKENIEVALEVAKTLGLDLDLFFDGMKKYYKDYGAFNKIKLNNTILLNGFSINDPESIKVVYNEVIKEYIPEDITILLNNRSDRPTRVIQHIELLTTLKCKKVILTGSNLKYTKTKLQNKINNEIEILDKIVDLEKEQIIFAIGNIGGKGMEIIEYFQSKGEKL